MIKQRLLTVTALLALTVAPAFALSGNVYAGAANPNCGTAGSAKEKVLDSIGSTTTEDCAKADDKILGSVAGIVQILSIIVGVAAIIMIIVAGLKYITSAGDSGKVSSAKTTLIYALIGVAVAALAQILVQWTANTVT